MARGDVVGGAQKISNLYGGLSSYYTLDADDQFGVSVAAIGDLNQDGVADLAVGDVVVLRQSGRTRPGGSGWQQAEPSPGGKGLGEGLGVW